MAKGFRFDARLPSWLAGLLLACLGCGALGQQADPPGRVAFVSLQQGSVVFAPLGAEDWQQLPPNRPLTEGDRLWTDPAARAELQLGTATLHLGSVTQLRLGLLEERVARFILQQGTANARVRDLQPDEDFEIDTPNLALRALQPGDYRLDVDPRTQSTRVIVHGGQVDVFGENGQALRMAAGQQATFTGRALAQVEAPYAARDEFGLWAQDRNRAQDQALAARYVPTGMVGAPQLDAWGTWAEDPGYGVVWYPTVTLVNWAPYRYGHWEWIPPWGWTWIDDAPWGFAPFHYGRWAMIGQRWAWVPGRLPPRPVYAPALVVFLGGGGTFIIGSGPAVGWYPLAPDEAWWPWYHASARYVGNVNPAIRLGAWPRDATHHYWRQHPSAVTAVREDEFRRGRPVDRAWHAVAPAMIDRARVGDVPARPQDRLVRAAAGTSAPPLHGSLPKPVQPIFPPPQGAPGVPPLPPAVRDQLRARQEQDRLQRQAERDARHQMREQDESGALRQRNAGKVDPGQPQRDAGRVDYGRSQRDAGRVQIDQGGSFDSGQGHGPRDPDDGRQARPRSR